MRLRMQFVKHKERKKKREIEKKWTHKQMDRQADREIQIFINNKYKYLTY